MGDRKNKKKQEKKKKSLKNRFAKNEPSPTAHSTSPQILFAPRGEVKMSEVVLDFIEPYADHWETEDQLKKLLAVALVAWNAAISPPAEGADLLKRTAAALPPDARGDYLTVVSDLIKRKHMYFSENRRMIIDYKLTMTDDRPHLTVISTLDLPG